MDNEILLKLYSLYQKELYLYLYSLCGDRHLAEDLLHETFLKALLALPDGHTNMRAWLYMVARNLFYNQQKKKSREILMDQQEYLSAEKTDEDLLEKILEEENQRMLYQAIRRLEIKKREIIQMQYFGGMSQKEIAAVLHITPDRVVSEAFRSERTGMGNPLVCGPYRRRRGLSHRARHWFLPVAIWNEHQLGQRKISVPVSSG